MFGFCVCVIKNKLAGGGGPVRWRLQPCWWAGSPLAPGEALFARDFLPVVTPSPNPLPLPTWGFQDGPRCPFRHLSAGVRMCFDCWQGSWDPRDSHRSRGAGSCVVTGGPTSRVHEPPAAAVTNDHELGGWGHLEFIYQVLGAVGPGAQPRLPGARTAPFQCPPAVEGSRERPGVCLVRGLIP